MDPAGSAKLFEQTTPVANRKQAARIGAALGDRHSIESTILAFTAVLQTLDALSAILFANDRHPVILVEPNWLQDVR